MGDASDSDRCGYLRLPLPADDADDAGDAAATMACTCCWPCFCFCCGLCCGPHICIPRRGTVGMVEARLRVFWPSAPAGCGDPSGSGGSGGFGLLGPRMRRSAAYVQSSPRSRHRWQAGWSPEHCGTTKAGRWSENERGGERGAEGSDTDFCLACTAFFAGLGGPDPRVVRRPRKYPCCRI